MAERDRPVPQTLSGMRVLEIGHFVAAPFCTRLLGDLGADVIKVEAKSGDPVRQWGELVNGASLWWSMHGRNKKSLAVDLKTAEGREIILEIVAQCDAVVENFRPGHLEKLGLGPTALRAAQPNLVIARISGFGQSGPDRDRAAFGLIGEAVGGLRYLTNHPPGASELPPVRVGVSIGDSIAGLYAAFGVAAALWQRDRGGGDGVGRTIDVALSEGVLSMMEGMLPEYGALGKIKQPTGGAISTAAPTNAYPTRDKSWLLIGANSEPLFAKLARLIGRPDLLESPDYAGNAARVRNAAALDAIIGAFTIQHDLETLLALLNRADIPNAKAYTAQDCANDPQYRSRGMIREVYDPLFGADILQAGVVPHIVEAPGGVRWPGPAIGAHTEEILTTLLGKSREDVVALRRGGVI